MFLALRDLRGLSESCGAPSTLRAYNTLQSKQRRERNTWDFPDGG